MVMLQTMAIQIQVVAMMQHVQYVLSLMQHVTWTCNMLHHLYKMKTTWFHNPVPHQF